MSNTRKPNAVRLEFAPDSRVQTNVSGAAITGICLAVEGGIGCGQPSWLVPYDLPIAGMASASS